MSFNKIIVVGNLGRDPELRYTPQGSAVCNFSVATSEKKRDKTGDLQDLTTWFRVTLWGKQAELASKYLTKGSSVYIEGRLRVEEWSDKDGKNRFTLEVNGSEMQFLSGGARAEEMSGDNNAGDNFSDARSGGSVGGDRVNTVSPSDDDIPF